MNKEQRKQTVHICKWCKGEFLARSDSPTKYCCKECRREGTKKPPTFHKHICKYCGNEFSDKLLRTMYCSKECRNLAKVKNIKVCPICNKTFHAKRKKMVFCSPGCANEFHTKKIAVSCENCGKELLRIPALVKKNKHHFCNQKCRDSWLAEHSELKGVLTGGGIYHHGHGYIFLYQSSRKYKAEHRLVMEQHLGRELSSDEIVHHKDGDKTNNDISNLEIVTRSEHINIHRNDLHKARGIVG